MGRQKFDDMELIAALNMHNNNVSRAAQELGVTRAAVIKRRNTLPDGVIAKTVEEFRTRRADTFARLQQILLQQITPQKLKGASLAQIGTLFGIMYDKERLEKNLSTENIAHNHYEALDARDKAMLKELVERRSQKKLGDIKYDTEGD
jgi:hypothetical protein